MSQPTEGGAAWPAVEVADQRPMLLALYAAAVAVLALSERGAPLHRALVQLVCELERALELPRTHQSRAERR